MTDVLVIGSGFAGVWSALGAARRLDELGVPAGQVDDHRAESPSLPRHSGPQLRGRSQRLPAPAGRHSRPRRRRARRGNRHRDRCRPPRTVTADGARLPLRPAGAGRGQSGGQAADPGPAPNSASMSTPTTPQSDSTITCVPWPRRPRTAAAAHRGGGRGGPDRYRDGVRIAASPARVARAARSAGRPQSEGRLGHGRRGPAGDRRGVVRQRSRDADGHRRDAPSAPTA